MTRSVPLPIDRTQLQHVVDGLDDGVILIEPDQTIAWANPSALAMHGVGSLAELGATVDEYRARFELRYRNRHRLPDGAHPLDRLVAGEASTEVTVQVGHPGEEPRWTHAIRSLVLTGVDRKPNCLALIINDVTARFAAEDRFESAFNANPAPAVIFRLSDLRHIRANPGFLELTGYAAEQVVGRSLHELDVLTNADRRELALERLHAGEAVPQMEGWLPRADGGLARVVLAGQPIEFGEVACILFTFADLQSRQRAEDALRHSERRFSAAFRLAPVPMLLISHDRLRVIDVNEALLRMAGHTPGAMLGIPVAELGLWDDATSATIEGALAHDKPVASLEVALCRADGGRTECLMSVEAVVTGSEPCALVVMQDVSERKRTEMELVSAVEAVLRDTSWFAQRVVEKLADLPGRRAAATGARTSVDLSPRERDVLSLLAQGLTDADIAARLGVSTSTTRHHVAAIYRKLGVRRRSAAVAWARDRGFGATTRPQRPRSARRGAQS